jgi:hypothetical protein
VYFSRKNVNVNKHTTCFLRGDPNREFSRHSFTKVSPVFTQQQYSMLDYLVAGLQVQVPGTNNSRHSLVACTTAPPEGNPEFDDANGKNKYPICIKADRALFGGRVRHIQTQARMAVRAIDSCL